MSAFHELPKPSITEFSTEVTNTKFLPNLPRANELTYLSLDKSLYRKSFLQLRSIVERWDKKYKHIFICWNEQLNTAGNRLRQQQFILQLMNKMLSVLLNIHFRWILSLRQYIIIVSDNGLGS